MFSGLKIRRVKEVAEENEVDPRFELLESNEPITVRHYELQDIKEEEKKRARLKRKMEEKEKENLRRKNRRGIGYVRKKPSSKQMLKIERKAQAISFMDSLNLNAGQKKRIENGGFLYLRISPVSMLNSVYELDVCAYEETTKEDFFTVSRRGVARFSFKYPDFTDLRTWEYEYALFYKVQSIFFFSKFRKFKNFYFWRNRIRTEKMEKCKSLLTRKLFLLEPELSSCLLQLRDTFVELENSQCLFSLETSRTITLAEFKDSQAAHRNHISETFQSYFEELKKKVKISCEKVLEGFLKENKIDYNIKLTYMEKAAVKRACLKLGRFVVLVDFLIADTLYAFAISSLVRLNEFLVPCERYPIEICYTQEEEEAMRKKAVNYIAGKSRRSVPVFHLVVEYKESETKLSLVPSELALLETLDSQISQNIKLVEVFKKMILDESFSQFSKVLYAFSNASFRNVRRLDKFIQETSTFVEIKGEMLQTVKEFYFDCVEYCQVFDAELETFKNNESKYEICIEEYRTMNIGLFETKIAEYNQQAVIFSKIPLVAVSDIFEVDSNRIKMLLLPSPGKCLEAVRKIIPKIMEVDIEAVIQTLNKLNSTAKQTPVRVKDFTQKCIFLTKTREELQDITKSINRISDLAELLEKYHWEVPEKQRTGLTYTRQSLEALIEVIEQCEARKVSDTERFINELKADIPRLEKELSSLKTSLDDKKFKLRESNVLKMVSNVPSLYNKYENVRDEIETLNSDQVFLELDVTDFETLEDLSLEMKVTYDLWHGIDSWKKSKDIWMKTDFKLLDVEEIEKQVRTQIKVGTKAVKMIPNNEAGEMLLEVVNEVKEVLPLISSLKTKSLKPRHWDQIDELADIGVKLSEVEGLTLENVVSEGLGKVAEAIQGIAVASVQEQVLEDTLSNVEQVWDQTNFEVNNYKEQKGVYILGSLEDIFVNLDDSLVTMSTIMGSRYVSGIKDLVYGWKNKLTLVQDTIDEWLTCQRNWIYLESIFSAPDIQRQLPVESKKFLAIDLFFKNLMKKTFDEPNTLKACTADGGLKERLKNYNEELDVIQKSLEDYLETKRSVFPRFYFLSNDELLEILSQTKDAQCVQPHLRKCFDALVGLDFGPDKKSIDIFAMLSPEGERIELGKNLKARGNVEDWLTQVEIHMKASLKKLMRVGLDDYFSKPRKGWVVQHPGQVVATIAQVAWVRDSESALQKRTIESWYETNLLNLQDLIALIRSDLTSRERKIIVALVTTDVHARDIIEKLKMDQINDINNFLWQMQLRYYFNFEEGIVKIKHSDAKIDYGYEYEGCTSRLVITPLTDRCWLTITGALNLKLGAAPAGPAGTGKTESSKDLAKALAVQCIVFNCSDQIDYKMMGKLFRGLAQTGCWTCLDEFNRIDIEVLSVVAQQLLTLRQARLQDVAEGEVAMTVFMGVQIKVLELLVIVTMNPGYAGRTELPDNLKVCFRPVSMMVPDYALIAEIMLFAEGFGDAKTLSRKMIKLFHLSSQQLSQQPHYDYGLRAVKSVLVMAGGLKRSQPDLLEDITLIQALQDSNVPKCLKEDLPLFFAIVKDLFPTITVPGHDYGEFEVAIREELDNLYLQKNDKYITKIVQQFDIFNIRFGATIVGPTLGGKTNCYNVLRNAMLNMKRRKTKDARHQHVVIKVLNPKCISMGELYGEFNEVTQEWQDGLASTIMRAAVNDVTSEHELIKTLTKAETNDISDEEFVGDHEEDEVRNDLINTPKAGDFGVSKDNLFVSKRWVVFDGPIDALWIENMNTVLDDNMTLCLANGERIKLVVEMKCLFEVNDLAVASPATVSRLGVMYMSPEDIGEKGLFQTFLKRLEVDFESHHNDFFPSFLRELMEELFDIFFPEALVMLREECEEAIETINNMVTLNFCQLLQSFLSPRNGVRLWKSDSIFRLAIRPIVETPLYLDHFGYSLEDFSTLEDAAGKEAVMKLFIFCLLWSIGATSSATAWEKFDSFVRKKVEEVELHVDLPSKGLIYDYFVNFFVPSGSQWQHFKDIIPSFVFEKEVPYFKLLVPNIDTTRYEYILKKLLGNQRPFFLTGVTGTGKSAVIENMLYNMSIEYCYNTDKALIKVLNPYNDGIEHLVQPIFFGFSAQTSSLITQESIESKLEKKRKDLLGAPVNKKVVIFVDDINMPFVEEYGAQQPIELLRFMLDMKGLYDRNKLFFKHIEDTVLSVAAAPPGGGRNKLTPRFKRHFNIINLNPADKDTLAYIFGHIFGGFIKGFNVEELNDLVQPIVTTVIAIFFRLKEELLPTPQKFHYVFNLRDVSKIFQGMLNISPKKVSNTFTMIKLFLHESSRVFMDRLNSREDKNFFNEILMELVQKNFKNAFDIGPLLDEKAFPIVFADFVRLGISPEERLYELSEDETKMTSALQEYLEEYNLSSSNPMNLVFFREALLHVSIISRIIKNKRGNALLIGVGGSGKRSLARLATSINEFVFFQIELVRNYGLNEFHEDVKNVMLQTSVENKPVVFLFTDSQIVDESFVEDINNVLSSGEIANLFPPDEMDKVLNDLIPAAKALNIPETRDNLRSLFITRIKDNLKFVLCMSPVGEALRVRCRNFPSLINCTTINWFMEWPQSALITVAEKFLGNTPLFESLAGFTEEIRASLITLCGEVHTTVNEKSLKFYAELQRKVYTTPKSYLDLISLYINLLDTKRGDLLLIENRMKVGVEKLEETNSIVDDLKIDLEKLQPVLKVKAVETAELLERVAKEKKEAEVVENRVQKDEAVVSNQKDEVKLVQEDAQKDLDAALPALNSAIKALDALDKKDITEMKSFAKPPPAVQAVMDAVCVLFGVSPSWDNSKKLLGDANFMKNLQDFDKDNIPEKHLKKVKKMLLNENMQTDVVQKVSKAALSLCLWVHAMNIYSDVAKTVEPKKKMLRELNEKLDTANALLLEKQKELQAVRDKVAGLEATLNETLEAKKALEDQSELTKNRLVRAEKLTTGLKEEGVRWNETLENTGVAMVALIGDVLLSAACISYFGAFTGVYREQLVENWFHRAQCLKIPVSSTYKLAAVMATPVEIRQWQINGLPTDTVSADSAILTVRGDRWPLLIDPQMQGNKWIKSAEKENGIEAVRASNQNLLRILERCIRNGRPLLIEDCTEIIDPALDPVLGKAVFHQNGRTLIRLGDSDVDYDEAFKFFLTTKLPNPHYLPEICIKVTIINFTVTVEGLTDQLIGEVVRVERPDIDKKMNELVVSMAKDSKQLKDLEAKILQLLSESEGNVLDDQVLISTLDNSKITSETISVRVQESRKTGAMIEEIRESYKEVALRGSLIYFVIAELANIDPMYQYSLVFFCNLFVDCLRRTPNNFNYRQATEYEQLASLDQRILDLQDFQTVEIFSTISRGLFEAHKVLFASLICFQILLNEGKISQAELMILLRGAPQLDSDSVPPQERKGFSDKQWETLFFFDSHLSVQTQGDAGNESEVNIFFPFEGLLESITNNTAAWVSWYEEVLPHLSLVPDNFEARISAFQKILLVNALREETTFYAISYFVEKSLGTRFVESPAVAMVDVYAQTNFFTPCIFVLSPGADPTSMLLKFAKEKGYGERLAVISLGQGQGARAEALINHSIKTGDWVLLQNCHLAKSWMGRLEKIVIDLAQNPDLHVHSHFRLYLTSSPCDYFPITVLQNGVKLTNEPPKGIRANVLRTFDTLISATSWDTCLLQDEWKKLSIGLSFFHALIQERRKFGALGWNIRYEFNDSDLETSFAVLRRFLEAEGAEEAGVPWEALMYVTGEINYGGRVTDDWDRRCLMTNLSVFFTEQVLVGEYFFSKSTDYKIPRSEDCGFEAVGDYLRNLPQIDSPEVFGMHRNAEISYQLNGSREMIDTMLLLQPRQSGTTGDNSPESLVLQLVHDISDKVPLLLDMKQAGPKTFVVQDSGLLTSLDTVLSQEIAKFNRIICAMNLTLVELEKAIKGIVVMSLDLDKMFTSFLLNQVPGLWSDIGFASRKPLLSWVSDLNFRVTFLRKWILEGQPAAFPLQAFFFPQGFMTGTLQTHARKYAVAVDELTFNFQTLRNTVEDVLIAPTDDRDGVVVYGMFMEGARYDSELGTIAQSNHGEMQTPLPPIHMWPEVQHLPDKKKYLCPVYKTSERKGVLSTTGMSTNFVVALELNTNVNPSVWVLTGCAALLNLDE
eukprot:maker-scaffold_13-snap-gene-5.1-mRNA-1 protein AED:0.01 eAED:0.01 QI:0/0/0/1/0.66/0.42/7/0/4146